MIIDQSFQDLPTNEGLMRTYLYQPTAAGRYPGVVLFSEIFQQTGPIQRMAQMIAGHGYVVAVPEIFHELEPLGAVLPYTPEGTERGNSHKTSKTLASYDEDAQVAVSFLQATPGCTGQIGTMGICIGGHLAFRAAMIPGVPASACFYATDIHKRSLGKGGCDDSLDRIGEIHGELLMIWGKQDPHIPREGRAVIHQALLDSERNFTWHEFNAAHAFMRDEGHRYDPQLALTCYRMVFELFNRNLHSGASH